MKDSKVSRKPSKRVAHNYEEPQRSVRMRIGRYEHRLYSNRIVDAMLVLGSEGKGTEHIARMWLHGAIIANRDMYDRTLARHENIWLLRNVVDGNFFAFPRQWFNDDYRRRESTG